MVRLFNSIRFRLILLVVLAVFPALGLIAYSTMEQRRLAISHAEESTVHLALDVSKAQDLMFQMTQQILAALAKEPAVRDLDVAACRAMFDTCFRNRPYLFYSNMGLIDSRGDLICSVLPMAGSINVANRHYFQEALRTREFSAGRFQIGRISGKPQVVFGYPIQGNDGQVTAVLFAALDVTWFGNLAADTALPPGSGSVLTIVDGEGTVLFRRPAQEAWIGRKAPETEIVRTVLARGEGVTTAVGLDGVQKIYAFRPLGQRATGGYVYVGRPTRGVYAEVERTLFHNLIGLALATAAGLAAVWIFGYLFITRRLNALVLAADKLAGGNLEVRTGLATKGGEIGRLAAGFDQMAESLQRREAERSRAEANLLEEKKFTDMIIESLPGAFYFLNAEGSLLRWNGHLQRVTGYSVQELAGMHAFDFYLDEDKPLLGKALHEVLEKGHVSLEAVVLFKDGSQAPYLLTASSLWMRNEQCVLGTGVDISDRKRAETALQENERLLKTILSTSPVGISLSENRRIMWANDAWEAIFGFRNQSEYLGRDTMMLYPCREEYDRVGDFISVSLGSGVPTKTDCRFRRQDGSLFDAHIRVNSLTPSTPTVVSAVSDISERKQAEEALRSSEQRLAVALEELKRLNEDLEQRVGQRTRDLVEANSILQREVAERKRVEGALRESEGKFRQLTENIHDVFWLTQTGNPKRVAYLSPAHDKVWGHGREDVYQRGSLWLNSLHSEDRDTVLRAYEGFLRGYGDYNIEYRVVRPDGSVRWIWDRAFPIADEEGNLLRVAGLAQDITRRKADQARQRELNDEIKRFAHIVSHDLRAPLANVSGFCRELETAVQVLSPLVEGIVEDLSAAERTSAVSALEDCSEALHFIRSSVTRMNELIDAILKLSRLGHTALEFQDLDMNELVNETLNTLAHQISRRRITVSVDRLPHTVADRTAMEQIIGNLLDNAIKYLDPARTGDIRITSSQSEQECVFLVQDNGIGILRQDQERIFQIFQRSGNSTAAGEGMGLAYVLTLVRRHGGRIWCESEPGAGSTFTFTIPTHPEQFSDAR